MNERPNIWGKPACELPNGEPCVACCKYFCVEFTNSPFGKLCRYAQPGSGCQIIFDRSDPSLHQLQPIRTDKCGPYHCSQSDPQTRNNLRLAAYNMKQVSVEELSQSME